MSYLPVLVNARVSVWLIPPMTLTEIGHDDQNCLTIRTTGSVRPFGRGISNLSPCE